MKKILAAIITSISIITLSLALACSSAGPQTSGKINVVVTIQPQLEFAQKTGAERITTLAMIPPGASPHTYEPLPSQITGLASADIYAEVGSGVEFELAWLDKITSTNNKMLLVDCSSGIDLLETSGEHAAVTSEEHHHGLYDPHIWMSPMNAITMAQNIMGGLIMTDPENSRYYEDNFLKYKQELMGLDAFIRSSLEHLENRTFLTLHPSFAYFARDYDLTMVDIEEEGKEPSASDITRIIETAKEQNIKTVIISPQFNPQSAQVIAREIGGSTVEIDVLSTNYLQNMENFVTVLLNSVK